MTMTNLEDLSQLARAATPGPWYARPNFLIGGMWVTRDSDNRSDTTVADLTDSEATAHYIAAANPTTILALIDRLRAAERVVEAARLLTDCGHTDADALSQAIGDYDDLLHKEAGK